MTANRNLKRRVRSRAAKTGESYTTALRHVRAAHERIRPFRPDPMGEAMPEPKRVRLAVAQTALNEDPADTEALRSAGQDVRRLMREARDAGAQVVQFPEGAICSPGKRIMSADGPARIGPADWNRCAWDVLREELAAVAELSGQLGLWTMLGSVHRLTAPNRPHNSLYVISDRGRVANRYDERMLSNTKISHMYAPGSAPLVFEAAGVRFGCLLGMEVHFPELFAEYERLDVDCVLFSSTGAGSPGQEGGFALEARGHAAANSYWVGYSVLGYQASAGQVEQAESAAPAEPAGVIGPSGQWIARCPADGTPSLVIADIDDSAASVEVPVLRARPWRRTARSGIYDPHFVSDPRSEDRSVF
jgi:predicted amidohydrolase